MTNSKYIQPDTDLMFVYGTLRVGEGNYEWCKSAVKWSIDRCTARGVLLATAGLGFPFCDFKQDGTVIGSLLAFDLGKDENIETFNQVCMMELGAGYAEAEIVVNLPWGDQVKALAWHYPQHQDKGSRLRKDLMPVPSGDWFEEKEDQRARRYAGSTRRR